MIDRLRLVGEPTTPPRPFAQKLYEAAVDAFNTANDVVYPLGLLSARSDWVQWLKNQRKDGLTSWMYDESTGWAYLYKPNHPIKQQESMRPGIFRFTIPPKRFRTEDDLMAYLAEVWPLPSISTQKRAKTKQ